MVKHEGIYKPKNSIRKPAHLQPFISYNRLLSPKGNNSPADPVLW